MQLDGVNRQLGELNTRLGDEKAALAHEGQPPCTGAAHTHVRMRAWQAAFAQEAQAQAAHAEQLHRASLARCESKMAADSSQFAVEYERLRQEKGSEMQKAHHLLTEAKDEVARAKAETLGAREEALRWQRRIGIPQV